MSILPEAMQLSKGGPGMQTQQAVSKPCPLATMLENAHLITTFTEWERGKGKGRCFSQKARGKGIWEFKKGQTINALTL